MVKKEEARNKKVKESEGDNRCPKRFQLMANKKPKLLINFSRYYFQLLIVVVVATAATRYYKVTEPDHVW
jgi:hypothetical protein